MKNYEVDILVEEIPSSRLHELDSDQIVFGREYSDHMLVADYENGEWQRI